VVLEANFASEEDCRAVSAWYPHGKFDLTINPCDEERHFLILWC
jgi:hypothetical protein